MYWEERGVQGIAATYPLVVFAIRPELGRRHRAYIRSAPGLGSPETVWYKCILPARASDKLQPPSLPLIKVAKFRDGNHFSMKMRYLADPGAGFDWIVNAAGEVVSAERNDDYTRNLELPRLETFRLGPLPPVVTDQGETDQALGDQPDSDSLGRPANDHQP